MFLVCGEALFDVFAGTGSDGGLTLQPVMGGSPFNVAIGLARLGQQVGFLGGVSTDPLGQHLMRQLGREGVDTTHVVRLEKPTTLSLVAQDEAGHPAYTFYGGQAADISLSVADLPAIGPDIHGLHLGSYTLAMPPAADALAALAVRERHRFISLDPNVRLTVQPDLSIWRERLAAVLPFATVVKASEEDIASLWPGADPVAVAQDWLGSGAESGPALVMLTRGADGAMAFTRQHRLSVAAETVAVIDTVGAGDAFQAALIDGLLWLAATTRPNIAKLEAPALLALLKRCNLAAALACSRRGADLPHADDLPSC